MDLQLTTETFVQDSQKWLASKHGTDTARSLTLDASKFDASMYPNDFIPSGTVIGLYTGNVYGAYDPAGVAGAGDVAVGILLEAVRVKSATSKPAGAVVEHVFVTKASLPFQSGKGSLDAAAETDIKHVVVR